MSLWDKVSAGIDRAAKATEGAIDEGKLRMAAAKARHRADKKAATLGYAVARARGEGAVADESAMTALVDDVVAADREAAALEIQVRPTPNAG